MNKAEIERMYPAGTRIFLESMHSEPQMPYGLKGTVKCVDGIGQIRMQWQNGSSLALNVDLDKFHIITEEPGGDAGFLDKAACLGYAKIGMEKARVKPDMVKKVLQSMLTAFADTSAEEAAEQFMCSAVRDEVCDPSALETKPGRL